MVIRARPLGRPARGASDGDQSSCYHVPREAAIRHQGTPPHSRVHGGNDTEDAVEVLRFLKGNGIEVWVDGGWGVDALLGKQSRPHDDIDLVIHHSDVGRLTEALAMACFRVVEGGRPFNFVMTDSRGREVDVHTVVFDAAGNGLYGPQPEDGSGLK